ncbi:MAG: molybdopterin-dependent oxidoreductase [Deltaproteobacteria bacterium]|jgi:putative selenate reductase molybdopterin-binding subunit|nr:molybdopterin-dependent oxidoreductase [Deltaproteobacteria bacterium]MBW2534791.1 molybdopterin-dependent oxidoreductase [Deltaproteobacteria bacterium]
MEIRFTLNGSPVDVDVHPSTAAFDLLRDLGLHSVKKGCDSEGACGACSVLLDGRLVPSCMLLAPQLEGHWVETVEGLSQGRELHPIQQAFLETGIIQCGYCTPAMVLAVKGLLDRTSQPTRDDIKDALSGIYCRCTGYEQIYATVDLAVRKLRDAEAVVELPKFRDDLRVVGKASVRVDGPQLVRAEPVFVEDKVPDDALHIKVLRSPHAHARIRRIDVSAAKAVPGVVKVLTPENAPPVLYSGAGQGYPEPSPYDRRLVDSIVRFVGDRVAAVAAETEEAALEALSKIAVEYEPLDPVFSIEAAKAEGAPLVHRAEDVEYPLPIHADLTRNVAAHNDGGIGDVAQGFAEADVVIERSYSCGRVHASPLEPHVALAMVEEGRLIVHASTQVPWHMRRILARILGIKENLIRVIKERMGGGFGTKQDVVTEDLAAWFAWETRRPCFIKLSREEVFVSTRQRHYMQFDVKLGAKRDGTLTAIEMVNEADTGAYGVHCLTVPMNACSKTLPLYRCPNMRFDVTVYYTTLPITGAYQGYGAPQGSFALQTALAELAAELGMDVVELHRKNMVHEGYLLEILECLGEGKEGIAQTVSSCGLEPCLDRACELLEWGQPVDAGAPHLRVGKGGAIVQQGSGLPGIDSANATLNMLGDGTFMLLLGGTDLGTGLDTVAIKIASEILQVAMEDLSYIAADTDVSPFDVGAYASSGTYFSGGAVYRAAEAMKQQILDAAAELLNVPAAELTLEYPATVRGPKRSMGFAELANKTQSGTGRGQLVAHGAFTADAAPIPYAAHFAQVRVDTSTGKVTVDRAAAIHDAGTPINPELALGQIYGGVSKAIGHALTEQVLFDDQGRMRNPSFLDYKAPNLKDHPDPFYAALVAADVTPGPFGAKSCSEIATNGMAPAIAVAIHDATGVWMRHWPFTAEAVLAALRKA